MSIIEKAMEKARQERATMQNTSPNAKEGMQETLKAPLHHEPKSMSNEAVQTSLKEHVVAEKHMAPVDATTSSTIATEKNVAITVEEEQEERTTQINPIPELIMASQEALTLGGSYRLLKEYIIALRKSQPEKSLFMITSPMRNEGKTLTSCNLACALAAEFDTTVLLIDVDLRAPSCQRVLGVKNPPKGLSDCLMHNTPITDCLIHTGIGKLSLLCAGSIIDNPAELTTSKRMQDFLLEVKHRYPDRIIILDSLPLLPFAESRALSRMVDGVILVVRENVTYKSHIEASLQHLQDVPLLGMVYNAATAYGTEKDIFNYSYYGYDAEEKK